MERIINKALEKDRNLRYQHAADARADLQRLKRDTESGKSAAVEDRSVPVASGSMQSAEASPVVPAVSEPSGLSAAQAATVPSSGAVPTALVAKHRWWLISAAAVLIIAVVAGLWAFRGHTPHPNLTQQHKSVAVLYFSNLSQDPSLNWNCISANDEPKTLCRAAESAAIRLYSSLGQRPLHRDQKDHQRRAGRDREQ